MLRYVQDKMSGTALLRPSYWASSLSILPESERVD